VKEQKKTAGSGLAIGKTVYRRSHFLMSDQIAGDIAIQHDSFENGEIGVFIPESIQSKVNRTAAGRRKEDNFCTGKIIAFNEGIHRTGSDSPPDRETDIDNLVAGQVCLRFFQSRTYGKIFVLFAAA
jgi:hypothetical protein